ncbi:hypothetical protein Tco_0852860 [Tanacetum coccineum]
MPYRLIYRGDRVTESPHVHNIWKPKAPWDIHPELRNAEMFAVTYELSYYHMRPGTSLGFTFPSWRDLSIVSGRLDDLSVKPDKTNKRKADNEENEEQVTGRIEGFFFEPVTKKRTTFPKCCYCQKPWRKIEKCFEYMRDLKSPRKKESFRRKARLVADDCGTTSSSKEDEAESSTHA